MATYHSINNFLNCITAKAFINYLEPEAKKIFHMAKPNINLKKQQVQTQVIELEISVTEREKNQ